MSSRKLVTISLPPRLLEEAEASAEKENRTKSEFFREALRFYLQNVKLRKEVVREKFFSLIDGVQEQTRKTDPRKIRSSRSQTKK